MLLEINFVIFLVSAVLATPPISNFDEKGLKSDSDDKLTNSIDDSSDDRPKRNYESGGYQWGSPNQADPFNPSYSPPNNYHGLGGGYSFNPSYPSSSMDPSNNPFQQSSFNYPGQLNNNDRNPLQQVMGKALESVIVASVRQLLDMTPLGSGGQGGDLMRSARSARSVENVLKISDYKNEKPEKVNFIEKLGSTDVKDFHSLEKREALSGEEEDSEEDPEKIRQQILQQNIMREMKRRKRMRQQAYQQSLKKYQEKINSQKNNSQNVSGESSWDLGMNDEQKLEYLSNYQKQLMDLYREKQNKERADRNTGMIRSGSKQSTRYSPPKEAKTMIGLDYPIDRQEEFSKFDQRKNRAKPFLSQKYSTQSEVSGSKIRKEGVDPGQGFIGQNFEETPQNSMMSMRPRNGDWSRQPQWDQSSQYFPQKSGMKDNRIKKLGSKSTIQQSLNPIIKPDIQMQEDWRPKIQQNQQFFNEFPPQNNMMSQQISNVVPGKQRFQRISTNEVCKDGFTPSGVPCTMDTNQMNDGSFINSPSNQEVLLQPPTLIKRYVTYSNRFIPPPSAVVEPVTSQEMYSSEGALHSNVEKTNSIGRRLSSDDGGMTSSQEQRNQGNNEGMMNGWTS